MAEEKTELEKIEENILKIRREVNVLIQENEQEPRGDKLTKEEIDEITKTTQKKVKEEYSEKLTISDGRLNNAQSELQKIKARITQIKEKKDMADQFQKYVTEFVKKMQDLDKKENWIDYTLQAKFKSIKDFKDHIKIHLDMKGLKGMDIKSLQGKFVGVLGRFGSGKSFLLNRLFELGFASAEDHTTEGVCFHLLADLLLTLIDTQGSSEGSQAFVRLNEIDKEIRFNEDEKNKLNVDDMIDEDSQEEDDNSHQSSGDGEEQEKLKEFKEIIQKLKDERELIVDNMALIKKNKMNEVNAMSVYVNNLVRQVCGVILYLVEEQNLETEREIKSLAEFCDKENKTLVVIMNYKKLSEEHQITEAVERDILKSSYVDIEYSKNENGKVVVDRYVDKSFQGKPIYRYILAKEESMAGMIYNRRTYTKIRDLVISSVQKKHFDYVKILNKHHKVWANQLLNFDGPQEEKDFTLFASEEKQSLICPFQQKNDAKLTYKDFDEKIEEVKIKQQHIEPKYDVVDLGDRIQINALVPQLSKLTNSEGEERDQFNVKVVRPDQKLVRTVITIESKTKKKQEEEYQKLEEYNVDNKNKIVYSDYKLEIVYDEGVILKKSDHDIEQTVDQGTLKVFIKKFDDRF